MKQDITWTQPGARPVVVRCDGSTLSQDAVAAATRQAARHGAPLTLLTTHAAGLRRTTHPAAGPLRPVTDDPKSVGERAWWRANHTDSSVAVQILTVTELHSERVARLAARARLLVVSGADVVGADAGGWSSPGRGLDRMFRCPVLVAGPPVTTRRRTRRAVVVGFSGSPQDADLMPVALAEAQLRDLDVVVVRAVPRAEELEPAMEDTWTALHTHCRDIPCRVVHLVATPAAALADQSAHGDLIVIGAHGAAPLGRLAAGSTTHETLRQARCDVLVFPLRDRAGDPLASGAPHSLVLEHH